MNNHLSQDDINRTDAFLEHHGILGMRWGIRRYQNKDGSLTNAGKRRRQIIDSSREEGIRAAADNAAQKKKGESVATALVLAKRKAKATGEVDKSFLNHPNISQKAKRKVVSEAANTKSKNDKKNAKLDDKTAKQFYNDSTSKFVSANNYMADIVNGTGENSIKAFNTKWKPKFEGYSNWQDSPNYDKYVADYMKQVSKLMNNYAAKDPAHNVKISTGETISQRYSVDPKTGELTWNIKVIK